MTALSTGANSQSPFTQKDIFIPFVAKMKINFPAGYGKRMERKFEMEKIANNAETSLNEALGTGGYIDEHSNPVKATIAFGDFVARLTINGNIKRVNSDVPKSPTDEVTVINTNNGVVGFGCVNAANRVVDPYFVQFANELNDLLNTLISDAEVMSIEVAGSIFGYRGRTF